MEILLFYVPCPDADIAAGLIRSALEQKLAACGQVIGAQSLYQWQGKLENEPEWLAIIKTLPALEAALEAQLIAQHPYEVPAIVRYEARVNQSYYRWMQEVTHS